MIFFCQKQLFFKFFAFYSTAIPFKTGRTHIKTDGHILKRTDT